MANMVGTLSQNSTPGERKIFKHIETLLDHHPECICYYEMQLGEFCPDFVLLSPRIGIIIIEVKDYLPKNLTAIPQTGPWTLMKVYETMEINIEPASQQQEQSPKLKITEPHAVLEKIQISNPFDQIYQYWRTVKNKIAHCYFKTQVLIPVERIVWFTNIEKTGEAGQAIAQIAPKKIHLGYKNDCKNAQTFSTLIASFLAPSIQFSKKNWDLLRANLIPTSRLPQINQRNLLEYLSEEDQIKLLDIEQEKLAHKIGDGHRLIFGVAGSGKTILLVARARYLALKYPTWRILILCYNTLLSKWIYELMNPQDYEAEIYIETFHKWAKNFISEENTEFRGIYNNAEKKARQEGKMTEFFQEFVPKLLEKTLEGLKDTNNWHYDAILIDEGQDFDAEWYKCVIKSLNPKTNSLLITCDGIQSIFERKKFHWSNVGINAKGRVKKLRKSYRNPKVIGKCAQQSLPKEILEKIDTQDEYLSTSEFLGIDGYAELRVVPTQKQEYVHLVQKIQQQMHPEKNVLILFKMNILNKEPEHPFITLLDQKQIPWHNPKDTGLLRTGVQISTIQSIKGLEADIVMIPSLEFYHTPEEWKLIYTAITRTCHNLFLSATRNTDLVRNLSNSPEIQNLSE